MSRSCISNARLWHPVVHAPAPWCFLLECWWVPLLRSANMFHVKHDNRGTHVGLIAHPTTSLWRVGYCRPYCHAFRHMRCAFQGLVLTPVWPSHSNVSRETPCRRGPVAVGRASRWDEFPAVLDKGGHIVAPLWIDLCGMIHGATTQSWVVRSGSIQEVTACRPLVRTFTHRASAEVGVTGECFT